MRGESSNIRRTEELPRVDCRGALVLDRRDCRPHLLIKSEAVAESGAEHGLGIVCRPVATSNEATGVELNFRVRPNDAPGPDFAEPSRPVEARRESRASVGRAATNTNSTVGSEGVESKWTHTSGARRYRCCFSPSSTKFSCPIGEGVLSRNLTQGRGAATTKTERVVWVRSSANAKVEVVPSVGLKGDRDRERCRGLADSVDRREERRATTTEVLKEDRVRSDEGVFCPTEKRIRLRLGCHEEEQLKLKQWVGAEEDLRDAIRVEAISRTVPKSHTVNWRERGDSINGSQVADTVEISRHYRSLLPNTLLCRSVDCEVFSRMRPPSRSPCSFQNLSAGSVWSAR